VRKADKLTTILVPLSRNLGTLTSWNPLGLSRPVMGLLYLYLLLQLVGFIIRIYRDARSSECQIRGMEYKCSRKVQRHTLKILRWSTFIDPTAYLYAQA